MSKMKSILSMAAMMTALAYGGKSGTSPNITDYKETDEERNERLKQAEIKRNKSNGLKEYQYGKNTVWAINQKVANKKAKKLNYL